MTAERAVVPDLFRHELRKRAPDGVPPRAFVEEEYFVNLVRAERLPLVDCGGGDAPRIAELAVSVGLTAYDAAYLSLAIEERAELASVRRRAGGRGADRADQGDRRRAVSRSAAAIAARPAVKTSAISRGRAPAGSARGASIFATA